jgi:hypothetical protein
MVQVVKEFAENEPGTICMDGKCIDPQGIKYSPKIVMVQFSGDKSTGLLDVGFV